METILIAAWLAQAVGFGVAGDERRCGFYKAAAMALFCGPLAALALIIVSPPRPPMP